jgi:hypothetical protein
MSEAVATRDAQALRQSVATDLPNPIPGVPWVIGIFIGAAVSYAVLRAVFNGIAVGPTPLMSIGTMLIGAAIATTFALAGGRPFLGITNTTVRASFLLLLSAVLAFGFWSIFSGTLKLSMVNWSFPIIGTVWWFIAATSFVGEEAHLAKVSPGRRTLLNALLWIAGTWVVLVTIVWIPPFWFGFVQTLLVTGGFAYMLRGVKQPTKSVLAWGTLALLTAVAIALSSWLGIWDKGAKLGPWATGGPTAEWGIFFGFWCGTNFGVLALVQSWPFSLIRQPWGTSLAVLSVIAWCAGLTWLAIQVFGGFYSNHATALLEAQVYAWQTVFWGFCFALLFGIGFSKPYRWAGQKTPGSWEDVA